MQEKSLKQNVKLIFALVLSLLCASNLVSGQENPSTEDEELIPPPIVILSDAEKTKLSAENDLKRRVLLCLSLADSRLQRAEQLTVADNFQDALSELGGYQAVIENGLSFLRRNNDGNNRAMDNFRRLEIALRSHTPRIEAMRRVTPFQFAAHLKTILDYARDARSRALDSFFGNTVIEEETSLSTNNPKPENKP
jgi:hypothetical protein